MSEGIEKIEKLESEIETFKGQIAQLDVRMIALVSDTVKKLEVKVNTLVKTVKGHYKLIMDNVHVVEPLVGSVKYLEDNYKDLCEQLDKKAEGMVNLEDKLAESLLVPSIVFEPKIDELGKRVAKAEEICEKSVKYEVLEKRISVIESYLKYK